MRNSGSSCSGLTSEKAVSIKWANISVRENMERFRHTRVSLSQTQTVCYAPKSFTYSRCIRVVSVVSIIYVFMLFDRL